MSLIPWSRRSNRPAPLFNHLESELAELFEGFPGWPIGEAGQWMPAIDVKDDDKHVMVKAELPGVGKDDIKLDVEGTMLTLRGEKKQEKTDKGDKWWRRETSYGSFMRRVALPCEVESEHAEAKMVDGVLEIRLPKAATTKAKTIKVG